MNFAKLLIIISLLGWAVNCKAKGTNNNKDTLDYWHIYYNRAKIRKYNINYKKTVEINIRNVKKSDSLRIMYFSDAPREKCIPEVTILNQQKQPITKLSTGFQGYTTFKLGISQLIEDRKKSNSNTYNFFYDDHSGMNKQFLFSVIFK